MNRQCPAYPTADGHWHPIQCHSVGVSYTHSKRTDVLFLFLLRRKKTFSKIFSS